MEKQVYITEERAKCKKVAEAFSELYEMADMVVVDVGRYGFVMLKYYMPPHGFEEDFYFGIKKTHPYISGYAFLSFYIFSEFNNGKYEK